MNEHVALWGWDTANWQKLHVDALGNLQVDVLTSGLPLGAATAANQATIIGHIDTLELISGRCYGFDTADWQYLQVEAAALHNLRVKLYDGANGIDSFAGVGLAAGAPQGLWVQAVLRGWDGGNLRAPYVDQPNADGTGTTRAGLRVTANLYGYNGASWDRLRLDAAYNLQVDVNEVRKTDTSTITSITVGVASTAVMPGNANRIFAEFVNDSDDVIYLALGDPAVMNRGIRLNANGGSFEIGLTNLYTGAVRAISSVAARNLTVSEG